MGNEKHQKDLEKRTFDFAVGIINFLKKIPHTKINDVIRYQLAKAGTSVGSNYEESQGAFSKEDFKFKVSLCFKEAKESNYWLRIIKATHLAKGKELDTLTQESKELKHIFASMMKKMNTQKD